MKTASRYSTHPGTVAGHKQAKAFSLIELMIVMGILALLMALAVSGFSNVTMGNSLTRAGQDVSDIIGVSRQQAAAKNRTVEVRFIELPSSTGGQSAYRAIQPGYEDDNGKFVPLARVLTLPEGVQISKNGTLSGLFEAPGIESGSMDYKGSSRSVRSVPFLASGMLGNGNWDKKAFFTIVRDVDAGSGTPKNFVSIYINPITGAVSSFRP